MLKLHNSLSKTIEEFIPIKQGKVGMYVCGPTVYDRPHIGNIRAIVVYDILFRILINIYGEENVVYVRNITDVDDKINKAAKDRKITIRELTDEITAIFHDDVKYVGALSPTIEPRATDNIDKMVEIINKLLKNNHAYIEDKHVYFAIKTDPNYAKLSGRAIDEMIAGARVEVAENKRHPGDFVLWKPADAEDDESSIFDSPFGRGRPGWHIECSAMSERYLGIDFDIHGGGADLMFPHHTNEIAQSTCANQDSHFAKYWVHNGFLTVKGEKMSKSLGNFVTLKDLRDQKINGEVIRYMLISTHYRKPFDFNDKVMLDAKKSLDGFYRVVSKLTDNHDKIPEEFISALHDDMNTPLALNIIHQYLKDANKSEDQQEINLYGNYVKNMGNFLGVLKQDAQTWFKSDIDENYVNEKIAERAIAKQAKDWAKADQIREELRSKAIIVEDHKDGTSTWVKL